MRISGTALLAGIVMMTSLARADLSVGNLPLWFEPAQNGYVAHGGSSEFVVSASGAEMVLQKTNGETSTVKMTFVGSSPSASVAGDVQMPGKINRLVGTNPSEWQSGLPAFQQIKLRNVYRGVDVIYYGNQRQLEFDIDIVPGTDPSVVNIRFDGAKKISVNGAGELVVAADGGEMIQHAPRIYQNVNGTRHDIAGGYKLIGRHTVGFTVGSYDRHFPLVIDPVLSYSTYFGGTHGDAAWAVAVDSAHNIYVGGATFSSVRFTNGTPFATAGAFRTNYSGGKLTGDAFVAKLDSTDTNLVFVTYLGGSGNDGILGLALDASNNVYVAGFTDSTNFPVTNAVSNGSYVGTNIAGVKNSTLKMYPTDAFVTELAASGSNLVYSTYLGGSSMDSAYGISVNPDTGAAYVAGYTYSTNFPVSVDAYQGRLMCTNTFYRNANAFVSAIAPNGIVLDYSTYLGGTNFDVARAIAYNNGYVFVAGYTASTNFPATNWIPQGTYFITNYMKVSATSNRMVISTNIFNGQYLNGRSLTNKFNPGFDAFVSAFEVSGSVLQLDYSTYLGGSRNDYAYGIAADDAHNAYVVGATMSTNFPFVSNQGFTTNLTSFILTNRNPFFIVTNAFLTKIAWNGTNASVTNGGFSAVFGGKPMDVATGVAIATNADGNIDIFVGGYTTSTNFPVINVDTNTLYLRRTNSGRADAFVIAFTNNCSDIIYSTYLGGKSDDFANAIAVDSSEAAYVVGQTLSTNFPLAGAGQNFRNGTNDTFIAKITIAPTDVPHLVILPPSSGSSVTVNAVEPNVRTVPGIILGWQASSPSFGVEETTDLSAPGGWTLISQPSSSSNGWYSVTVPATNSVQFFRLRKF